MAIRLNVVTRPSNQIPLHRAILSQNKVLSLNIIEDISTRHPQLLINGLTVCFTSPPRGTLTIDPRIPLTKELILAQKKEGLYPNVFEINGNLQNALHLASAYGLIEVVRRLLQLGAEPNFRDGFGRTALHYAASGRHNDIINLLISNGARIDLRDQNLAFPYNAYLISSEQTGNFSQSILDLLKVDYLIPFRIPTGGLLSSNLIPDSAEYHIQKLNETCCLLMMRMDEATGEFGQEFYNARREHHEPDKNKELVYSRKALIIMANLMNRIKEIPSQFFRSAIETGVLFTAFTFLGSLAESIAKECKTPYQVRIPWNALATLPCIIKNTKVGIDPHYTDGILSLINNCLPILRSEILKVINDFNSWLNKNSQTTYIPPYRHLDLTLFYNLTDYFHDSISLQNILEHLDKVKDIDPATRHGRRSLLQVVKIVADLTKYQQAGRNLTRTLKQKLSQFPWEELNELRDKLAKISLTQENVNVIQLLIENDEQFFIDLKTQLNTFRFQLRKIFTEHEHVAFAQLEHYYQSEPISELQARDDMQCIIPIDSSVRDRFIQIINDIKNSKTVSRTTQLDRFREQRSNIENNSKMDASKKASLLNEKDNSINNIRKEINDIYEPFDVIIQNITSNNSITLKQRNFLLSQSSNVQQTELKTLITRSSSFRRILELEQKLSSRLDRTFNELDLDQKFAIIKRTRAYLDDLCRLVIPDEDFRRQLIGNNNIFNPGHDNFGSYLIEQYNRIQSDPNLLYSSHFLAVEVQQSLRFLSIGGNVAFRVHLEHDERLFSFISSNRFQEELNEILHNITKDYQAIEELETLHGLDSGIYRLFLPS